MKQEYDKKYFEKTAEDVGAKRYYDVHGIDFSEYAIREAKQRTRTAKLSVGDVTDLDYRNNNKRLRIYIGMRKVIIL